MKHISLFSGIGGFDLAAQWMGWENVAHCEWNPFGRGVLKNYWPNSISYDDITKTDFTIHRGTIDILTGGFPCQPYSVAGKRKGKEDERHLWPEMLRAIREIQPRWVVGENVRGIINWDGGMVFDEVQSDLETEGYEILPFLLPAAGVNAPHERYRTWFVAYSHNNGRCSISGHEAYIRRENEKVAINSNVSSNGNAANPTIQSSRRKLQQQQGSRESGRCNCRHERLSPDTSGTRQSGKEHRQTESGRFTETCFPDDWQNFPTQSPVCNGDDGFPTESLRQFFREDSNGVISEEEIDKILYQAYRQWRNETIKAGGNAVVPKIPHQIFKTIQQYENQ